MYVLIHYIVNFQAKQVFTQDSNVCMANLNSWPIQEVSCNTCKASGPSNRELSEYAAQMVSAAPAPGQYRVTELVSGSQALSSEVDIATGEGCDRSD